MKRLYKITAYISFFIGIWLFWWFLYPHALGFREQNQLFLFSRDFLWERLSTAGGLADWISEFITQFNVIPALGSALLGMVLTLIQVEVYILSGRQENALSFVLSFIPSLLIILFLGDIYALPSFPVAILLALAFCILYDLTKSKVLAFISIPALLWLVGPVAWLFVAHIIISEKKSYSPAYIMIAIVFIFLQQRLILPQYPVEQTLLGINYYALPLEHPYLQHIIFAATLVIPFLCKLLPSSFKGERIVGTIAFIILLAGTYAATFTFYDKDTYEIIAYDQLIRNEKWDEVVRRAEKYQPESEIGCVSVNLSLFMTGRYDRLDDFRQCGAHGLLMPRVRDNISDISTCEAFWRLGMINEALRYAFDLQESIPNLRKSPRFMMRMAQCQILNGRYKVASKYLDILSKTLFYRKWSEEQKEYLFNDTRVMSDPVYNYLQSVRQSEDFLYYYPQMDKMLAKLYLHNSSNLMASWYYQAWTYLNDNKNNEETDTDTVHGN